MFGWKLLRDSEIALQRQLTETRVALLIADCNRKDEYIRKCEALIEHERGRIDAERERADRIADALFQSSGLPATSVTVLAEQKAADNNIADKRATEMKQLLEIYSDMDHELVADGAEPLPEELAETLK